MSSFAPQTIFFLIPLTLGSFLSISSTSWVGVWIGLELNLMSFIPLITIKNNSYSSEAALKYFLIQASASAIIIMASSLQMAMLNPSSYLLLLALLMKLGAAPFHFWLPQVMEGLSWPQISIIMSLQKLAPLYLISHLNFDLTLTNIIILASILSAILGSLNGYNTSSLRKILAFSSINHMSWMLISISMNETLWTMYYMFYIIISFSIIYLFYSHNMFNLSDLSNFNSRYLNFFLLMPVCFFSLGGLPPFSGFIPKWFIIQMMIYNNMYIILSIMLISALITLFFYIRVCIFFLLFSSPNLVLNAHALTFSKTNSIMSTLIVFNSFLMFIPLLFLFL